MCRESTWDGGEFGRETNQTLATVVDDDGLAGFVERWGGLAGDGAAL